MIIAPVYAAGETPIEGASHLSLAEGIRARAGLDFELAQDGDHFAAAVLHHLNHANPAMQHAARVCILANYDWERNLSAVDDCFEPAGEFFPSLEKIHGDNLEIHPA